MDNSNNLTKILGTNIHDLAVDYPAAETYDKFSTEKIIALCALDLPCNQGRGKMPSWDTQSEWCRFYYRLKAYWILRVATDPSWAAFLHAWRVFPLGPEWTAADRARATGNFSPKKLNDFERKFLAPVIPDIRLIIDRCPQVAMIHALRGDVSEPYWWAVLSITEHAAPNLSRECSNGYPGFSEKELAERVERIHREGKKPALCSRLHEVNTDVCRLCKFKGVVRSPIALGYEHEPKKTADLV